MKRAITAVAIVVLIALPVFLVIAECEHAMPWTESDFTCTQAGEPCSFMQSDCNLFCIFWPWQNCTNPQGSATCKFRIFSGICEANGSCTGTWGSWSAPRTMPVNAGSSCIFG